MPQTLEAVFDGEVLCPQEPLQLKPNTRVRIVVESLSQNGESTPASFLDAALSLNLDGPSDWSHKVDQYLYGGLHDDE
jgi:hypothetical protein